MIKIPRNISIAPVAFRVTGLASKFVFFMVCAAYLTVSDIALFALVSSLVYFAVFLFGLEYHTHTSREISDGDNKTLKTAIFRHGFLALGTLAPLILVLALVPGFWASRPIFISIMICALIVTEQLSAEATRILNAKRRYLHASIALFLRAGAWTIFTTISFFLFSNTRNIEFVLITWLFGNIAATIFASSKLASIIKAEPNSRKALPPFYLGLRAASPFLIGAISFRGLNILDRFLLSSFWEDAALAAYAIFYSMSVSILVLADAMLIVPAQANAVFAARKGEFEKLKTIVIRLSWQVLILTSILGVLIIIVGRIFVITLGKPEYIDNFTLLPIIVMAQVFFTLSIPPHVYLYSLAMDKKILLSNLSALPVFLLVEWATFGLGPVSIAISLACAFFSIMALKIMYSVREWSIK